MLGRSVGGRWVCVETSLVGRPKKQRDGFGIDARPIEGCVSLSGFWFLASECCFGNVRSDRGMWSVGTDQRIDTRHRTMARHQPVGKTDAIRAKAALSATLSTVPTIANAT